MKIYVGIILCVFIMMNLMTVTGVEQVIKIERDNIIQDDENMAVIIEFEDEPVLKYKPILEPLENIRLIVTKYFGETEKSIKDNKKKKYEDKIKLDHKKLNLKIKNEYIYTMNGIATTIKKEDWIKIENMPNIKKIWRDENLTVLLQDSVPLINADDVWKEQNASGSNITGLGIKVAIIDTGIDYTHPDLGNCTEASFLAGTCARIPYGYDFYNDDTNPYDDSLNGHGTHCAGIVGANGTIKGVAPDVTLIAYKVCSSLGSCPESNIISAIENATLYGVDIISMSLGGSGYSDDIICDVISSSFDSGVNIISASGNYGFENYTIGTPAACEHSMAIGSLNKNNTREWSSSGDPALYSNNTPSFFKPDVMSYGASINSTKPSNSYGVLSGTSMSTPHIAGLMALMKQAYPSRSNEELESIISTNTEYMNLDGNLVGGGIADALLSYNANGIIIPNNILFYNKYAIGISNYTQTEIMNLTNIGNVESIFNISIINFSESDINVSTSSVLITLSANESGLFNLTMFMNESKADGRYHGYINISNNNTNSILYVPFEIEKRYAPDVNIDIDSWYAINTSFKIGYHQSGIVGNKLYIFGGYDIDTQYSNRTRYATIDSNGNLSEFQLATAMIPAKLALHKSVVLNDVIYSLGGFDWDWYVSDPSNICNSKINRTFYAIPESGGDILSWYEGAQLPVFCTRLAGGVVGLNNTLYYIGGEGYPDAIDTDKMGAIKWGVYYTIPEDNGNITEWKVAQHLPTVIEGQAVTIYNNTIYVFGGAAHTTEPDRKVYYAKPDDSGNITSWTTNSFNIPEQLRRCYALTVDDKIYLIGGFDELYNGNIFYYKEIYYTTPNSNGEITYWNKTRDLPDYLDLASVETYNDLIYFIGGFNLTSDTYSSTIFYNPIQYELQYFNNDESSINITFSSASSNTTGVFINISNNAIISSATMNVSGVSSSFNGMCYQETVNISTSCGGLSNGSYNATKWNQDYEYKVYDGYWDTYAYANFDAPDTIWINYSKPINSTNSSLWMVKDNNATVNLTIDSSCWSESSLQFKVVSLYDLSGIDSCVWYCYNSTDWHILRNNSGDVAVSHHEYAYEEAMWWNISTSVTYPTSPSIELNGTRIWNYTGTYNTIETTSDFTTELQNEIDECENPTGNNCTIYFNITSESAGIVGLSNLNIAYTIPADDSTSPTYSDNSTNTTYAGQDILHSLQWTDDIELATTGGFIFSFDNGTGTFTNGTWTAFTTNPDWSNVTKSVNTTVGTTIQWKVYANDTSNNWVESDVYAYETTTSNTCTPPSMNNDWTIMDSCSKDTSIVLGTGKMTISNGYLRSTSRLSIGGMSINNGRFTLGTNGELVVI